MDNEVLRFESPDGHHSLILDDDGRTCYAYLLDGEDEIVGDCWLYNRGMVPVVDEWTDPKNMPFANSARYVKPHYADGYDPICAKGELTINWIAQGVKVHVRGRLFARVIVGAKPGWSMLAVKDGPLALTLPG